MLHSRVKSQSHRSAQYWLKNDMANVHSICRTTDTLSAIDKIGSENTHAV